MQTDVQYVCCGYCRKTMMREKGRKYSDSKFKGDDREGKTVQNEIGWEDGEVSTRKGK